MIQIYYVTLLGISLICSAIYLYIWHRHFDVNLTMIFTLIPISCLGYFLHSMARSMTDAITSLKIIYIGGFFLPLFMLLAILSFCQIHVPRWGRVLLFSLCLVLYSSVLFSGYGITDLFYTDFFFEIDGKVPVLYRNYGIMHSVFYALVGTFFAAGIIIVVYSWRKKRQVPRTLIYLLVLPDVICTFCYFIKQMTGVFIEFVPVGYILAQIVYLIIAHRASLYNVSDTVIESMVREREIGFISFDFRCRYLGSNEKARILVPELGRLAVDDVFGYKPAERKIRHFLDRFQQDPGNAQFVYTYRAEAEREEDEKIFNVNVNYLYEGNRKRGYIVTFIDDTTNRKYIQLLDSYNENLQSEVAQKTQHIVEMHDNLILSLATMVESRDNSTGGHIRRTSEGVRILVEEIQKEGKIELSEKFCRDVIKAAPMHDLGKIAVDDAVLRKPGRFTDEEYEKMKHHAAEGARVIHEILLHTEDEDFKILAENVAHYHHERWDGSGYPEKLVGENIPLEARIMAIADVYDALVSKRVYKDAFSFDRADTIIREGMGTQFDPALAQIYEMARPRLEEYYRKLQET